MPSFIGAPEHAKFPYFNPVSFFFFSWTYLIGKFSLVSEYSRCCQFFTPSPGISWPFQPVPAWLPTSRTLEPSVNVPENSSTPGAAPSWLLMGVGAIHASSPRPCWEDMHFILFPTASPSPASFAHSACCLVMHLSFVCLPFSSCAPPVKVGFFAPPKSTRYIQSPMQCLVSEEFKTLS